LKLLPEGTRLEAHLFVPTHAIGFVRPGQPVRIRYPAYPYQKYGHHRGVVERVSLTALDAAELAQSGMHGGADVPHYRVVVALEHESLSIGGRDEPLRAGSALEAVLPLERRRLIDWILAPALARGAATGADLDAR
jgi:membrane fusion protein